MISSPAYIRNIRRKFVWLVYDIRSVARLHGIGVGALYAIFRFPWTRSLLSLFGCRQMAIPVNIHGSRMYLNMLDIGLSRQLLVDGTRERAHVAQIKSALRPGNHGIELGANIGFFALLEGAVTAPGGRIWCIEPVASNLKLLRRNIIANGLQKRTEIFRYLIGDRNGTGSIQLSDSGNSHAITSGRMTGRVEAVPMITLDSFMHENRLLPEDIQFLRMDIDGYEVIAIQGMKMLMEAKTPLKLFIEFHPQAYPERGYTFEGFLATLAVYGFAVRQAAKECERDAQNREITVVLDHPSTNELVAASKRWRPGGIQAFLERS